MQVPNILIIDDVSSIVDEFILLLELLGLRAVGAQSVNEGLAKLEAYPSLSVVVSDVRFPRQSGFDLLPMVNSSPALMERKLTFFFMSGEMQLTTGHDGYAILTKPVDIDYLVSEIRSALSASAEQ